MKLKYIEAYDSLSEILTLFENNDEYDERDLYADLCRLHRRMADVIN